MAGPTQVLTHLLTALILAGAYAGLLLLLPRQLAGAPDAPHALAALLVVMAFLPVRGGCRVAVRALIPDPAAAIGRELGIFAQQIRDEPDQARLAAAYTERLGALMRPEALAVFLLGNPADTLHPIWSHGVEELPTLDAHHPAIAVLRGAEVPVLLREEEGEARGPFRVAMRLAASGSFMGVVFMGSHRFRNAELDLFGALTEQLAQAMRTAQLVGEIAGQERLKRELEIAAEMQMGLLAKEIPMLHGASMAASCTPAHEVGGDFYDFVGDVSGKGVPAAIMMAVSLTIFRTVAPGVYSPAKVLGRMNQLIHQNRPNKKLFVTAAYLIYDAREGSVQVANAGQPLPLHNGRQVSIKGLPLGVAPKTVYRELKVMLEANDTFVLYSDGLEDAENAQGQTFGAEAVMTFFAGCGSQLPDLAHSMVKAKVRAFMGTTPQADDLTLVLLQRAEEPEPLPAARNTQGTEPLVGHTQALDAVTKEIDL